MNKARKEGYHKRVLESIWSNGFKNPFDHYFARSVKKPWECFTFYEFFRAKTKWNSQQLGMKQ